MGGRFHRGGGGRREGREASTERTRIEASMLFARYFALVIIINVHFYELHFTSYQPSDNMIDWEHSRLFSGTQEKRHRVISR